MTLKMHCVITDNLSPALVYSQCSPLTRPVVGHPLHRPIIVEIVHSHTPLRLVSSQKYCGSGILWRFIKRLVRQLKNPIHLRCTAGLHRIFTLQASSRTCGPRVSNLPPEIPTAQNETPRSGTSLGGRKRVGETFFRHFPRESILGGASAGGNSETCFAGPHTDEAWPDVLPSP